jgi:hypothetical protein
MEALELERQEYLPYVVKAFEAKSSEQAVG